MSETSDSVARAIANQAIAQLFQSLTGSASPTVHVINPTQLDEYGVVVDTGALVQQAFNNGNKYVIVDWYADGQERHWNSIVNMPVGAILYINGPASNVETLGGNVRTDRSCYQNGRKQGTAALGSPMIFQNQAAASQSATDNCSLIACQGNNLVLFGEGTYLHDPSGMTSYEEDSGLIILTSSSKDTPTFVGGGGAHCQFYLSGSLVNTKGGTTTCEIRCSDVYFSKVTADDPQLVSITTGSEPTGWTQCELPEDIGPCSFAGLERMGTSNIWFGA